jgi:hypothetical protein
MFLKKTIGEGKSWMSVELLGGRERKRCGVVGKEKECVESWNHC